MGQSTVTFHLTLPTLNRKILLFQCSLITLALYFDQIIQNDPPKMNRTQTLFEDSYRPKIHVQPHLEC